ncbi:hypothetical protein PFICI_07041 [Pestalotiopsis fici W106-1]|uniref:Uncharacterized protein n=1 Tax=Pestalotiopsis fici (strain W106-1 / CGMCC3.15140) TaxID=1229662 RepID=W3X7N6_PESFW|nr:uncharacterized protein PFICI_07041 [Pestalotiopsis fici W106-1]ETS82039.1 hypothetical protein PFICI_07041 [Pestalotiopsis fici W106-1]
MTLEDDQGRWSGLLRVMDDDAVIESGQTIQLVAISKGSTSRREAAQTYEVYVDNCGYYNAGNVQYQFESVASTWRISEESIDDAIGSAVPSQKERSHTTCVGSENEKTTPDLGKLNSKNVESRKLSGWGDEIYFFYNVLWVETIDGVMYRKAAGRIPEDIWEQTCGIPQRIVLG